MGFGTKQEYDELYDKCVAMDFGTKQEYDKCNAMGFGTKGEYDAFVAAGFESGGLHSRTLYVTYWGGDPEGFRGLVNRDTLTLTNFNRDQCNRRVSSSSCHRLRPGSMKSLFSLFILEKLNFVNFFVSSKELDPYYFIYHSTQSPYLFVRHGRGSFC